MNSFARVYIRYWLPLQNHVSLRSYFLFFMPSYIPKEIYAISVYIFPIIAYDSEATK